MLVNKKARGCECKKEDQIIIINEEVCFFVNQKVILMSLESELCKVNDYRTKVAASYTELAGSILEKRKLSKTKKVAAIGAILALFGCSTPTDPIEDIYVNIKIKAPTEVVYTEIQGMGSGPVINHTLNSVTNAKIKIEGNNKSIEAIPGQEVDLGQVKKNTIVNYTTTITGDFVFPSVISDTLQATGNVLTLPKIDVFDTRTFNPYTVSHWLLLDQNTNWRWAFTDPGQTYGTLDLSFNPDTEGTGARLSDSEIFMTENTLEAIASRSKGKMIFDKATNSNRNGNYTTAQGVDGEFRTFYTSNSNVGVGNVVYPNNGDRVKSSVMLDNPAHSGVEELPGEIVDALYQGNENVSFDSNSAVKFQYFTINGQTYKLRVNKGRVEQFNLMLQNDLTALMSKSGKTLQGVSTLMLPANDLWAAIEATYSRPAGNDQGYKFYLDHEERTEWPSSTTMSEASTTSTKNTSFGYSSPTISGSAINPQMQNTTMPKNRPQQKTGLVERIREKH